jgi:flagellar basal-body rod protein FlgC
MHVHLLIRALTTTHDGACSGWNNGISRSFNFLEERHRALRLLGGKMIAALSSTVSALRSFVTKLGVTADNVANVNTDGFKKGRATLHEDHNGAVRVEISRDTSPGFLYDVVENNQVVEKETSNVDLAEEIPDLMITKRAYQANLKTLETQDEMLGSLLDIIG